MSLLYQWFDILGSWTLRILDQVKLDSLTLSERFEAGASDRRVVDENILRPVIGFDEPKALLIHEALNRARFACHFVASLRWCNCSILKTHPMVMQASYWARIFGANMPSSAAHRGSAHA
jgi:hypothetical protein